jgi:hypothetical protein
MSDGHQSVISAKKYNYNLSYQMPSLHVTVVGETEGNCHPAANI